MPQIAAFVRITCEIVGVGTGPSQRRTRKALSAIMLAHSSANCSPRNLVSYPTTITLPGAFVAAKWEQIALVTDRTPAKVNSSAITARQPDVPNLMVMSPSLRGCLSRDVGLTTRY